MLTTAKVISWIMVVMGVLVLTGTLALGPEPYQEPAEHVGGIIGMTINVGIYLFFIYVLNRVEVK